MKKCLNKCKKINYIIFIFLAIGFACFFANLNTNKNDYIKAEFIEPKFENDVYVNNSNLSTGEIQNNLFLISFSGEETDCQNISTYKSIRETFDTFYTTGEHSVKNYYHLNSNGALSVNTPILTTDTGSAKVFYAQQPRTYYMQYIIKENGSYKINPNGYFDYFLVKASSSPTSAYVPYFYDNSEVVAKVFKTQSGISSDRNMSDGIISYDYAEILANNNSSYYLVESYQRYFREYELWCDIFSQAKSYIDSTKADVDNDSYLDSVSIAMLNNEMASKYNFSDGYYWGSLLWPHKIEINWVGANFRGFVSGGQEKYTTLFQKNGYTKAEAERIVNYLYNKPTTDTNLSFNLVNLADYDMRNLDTASNWSSFVSDISTCCHEFGHILGLPDLYNGSGDTTAVGSWSHMCSNPYRNSFFTSYERETLGWLNENNVVKLTEGGTYTLNVVDGLDGNEVVAYKYNDPSKGSRNVYFEYRNSSRSGQFYDSQCGKTGLLVYVTDSAYSVSGNQGAPPYEIYVQRLSDRSVSYASLDMGESLGNLNTSSLTNAIIYDKDGSEKNSGLKVTVLSKTDTTLTFKFEGKGLDESNNYTISDFRNNALLYKKLLENLPSGKTVLNYDCFKDCTILNLDSIAIDDLYFFDKFDLSSIKYINLADNLLSYNSFSTSLISIYQNVNKLILSGNLIDLSQIPGFLLADAKIIWGIQYDKRIDTVYKQTQIQYYYKSTDELYITYDGVRITQANQVGNLVVNGAGKHTIRQTFNSTNSFGLSKSYEVQITVFDVTSKYNSDNPLVVYIEDRITGNASDFVNVSGINTNSLTFNFTLPQIGSVGLKYFTISVSLNGKKYTDCNVYYMVYSAPTVTFNGGKNVFIELNDTYEEKGLTVYQDGQIQSYTQSESRENGTYYVEFYYKGGTVNADGTANLSGGEVKTKIDTSEKTTYVVSYVVVHKYGKIFRFYNQVTIMANIIKKETMELGIYNELLRQSGKGALVKDDFIDYDYLDLSNLGVTSITGLYQLDLKTNVKINLNNNNLSNIQEQLDLISKKPNILITLIFNKFSKEDILALNSSIRSNFIFGIQNLNNVVFDVNSSTPKISDFYNDYESMFTFTCSVAQIKNNEMYFNEFGQYGCEFKLNDGTKNYYKNVSYISVQNINPTITKEYSDDFSFNLSQILNIQGININSLRATSNLQSLDLSKIGNKTLDITLSYLNQSVNVLQSIAVVDTQKPTITISGDTNVYVKSTTQYNELYAGNTVTALDGYDGEISVATNSHLRNDYGVYDIVYTATDTSGNSASLTRTIYVGTCELSQNNEVKNYNRPITLPLRFITFSLDDFNISYKLDTNSQYKYYNNTQGIILKSYGFLTVNVKLVHKNNSNLIFNLDYNVNVQDIEKPTITLKGNRFVEIYAGEKYVEYGIEVSDNSTNDVLSLNSQSKDILIECLYQQINEQSGELVIVNKIDTASVGKYKITYKAEDVANNTNTAERYVTIIYHPIKEIYIKTNSLQSRYSAGRNIVFTLSTNDSDYVDPNPMIIWYVNGEEYQRTYGLSANIQFDTAGDYVVSASMFNANNVSSQEVSINIYEESKYSTLVIIICATIAAVVVGAFVCYFISRYRKRNFY